MPKPLRCAIKKRPDFEGPHAAARTETRPVVIGIRVEFERGLPHARLLVARLARSTVSSSRRLVAAYVGISAARMRGLPIAA